MSLHVCIQFILRKRVKSSNITPVLKPLSCEQKTKWNYVDISFPIEKGRRLMVYLHWQWPILSQDRWNGYRTQWESVLVSVSVQYEHLHIIIYKPFLLVFVSVLVSGSVNTPLFYSISRSEAVNILSTGIWNQSVIRRHHFYACVQMLYHCMVCVSPPLIEFHSIDNKTWEPSHPLLNTKSSCPDQICFLKWSTAQATYQCRPRPMMFP